MCVCVGMGVGMVWVWVCVGVGVGVGVGVVVVRIGSSSLPLSPSPSPPLSPSLPLSPSPSPPLSPSLSPSPSPPLSPSPSPSLPLSLSLGCHQSAKLHEAIFWSVQSLPWQHSPTAVQSYSSLPPSLPLSLPPSLPCPSLPPFSPSGVKMESTFKCEESPDEMVTTETEDSYQVSCFIAQDVKYMHTALRKVGGRGGRRERKGQADNRRVYN